jgi:DNA-binding response OmpR family regulator
MLIPGIGTRMVFYRGCPVQESTRVPIQVLVTDDDRPTAQALGRVLQTHGYQAGICHTAAETLHAIGLATPDALLVDVHLPDMNGLVLTQRLRATLGGDVPIIVISGDTSMETLGSLPYIGATYFLSKPTTAPLLIEKLAEALRVAASERDS